MESYQEELSQIKIILKNNPKGMTVTDIAREININRNSVAKYLDILLISGHADMVTFGPAKVFFPSSRIPLSAMLNFTLDYIALLDRNLTFIQINDNLLKALQIERSDIIGQPIDAFKHSFFELPEIAHNAHQALNGKEQTLEKTYSTDTDTCYLSIKHVPTTFDDGEPGVTLIIEDITRRKQAEEKMNQAVIEWETTFNSITDMIFIQDNDFSIIRANTSFARFLRMEPVEFLGKKCYHLIHGMNQAHSACPCTQVHKTRQPATVEFYEPHLQKYLEVSASPIFNEQAEITGSVHIMKDITERKKKDQ